MMMQLTPPQWPFLSNALQDDRANRWQIDDLSAENLRAVAAVRLLRFRLYLKIRPRRVENFFVRYAARKSQPCAVLLLIGCAKSDHREEPLVGAARKGHCSIPGGDHLVV